LPTQITARSDLDNQAGGLTTADSRRTGAATLVLAAPRGSLDLGEPVCSEYVATRCAGVGDLGEGERVAGQLERDSILTVAQQHVGPSDPEPLKHTSLDSRPYPRSLMVRRSRRAQAATDRDRRPGKFVPWSIQLKTSREPGGRLLVTPSDRDPATRRRSQATCARCRSLVSVSRIDTYRPYHWWLSAIRC
jgi:hypothetical protein